MGFTLGLLIKLAISLRRANRSSGIPEAFAWCGLLLKALRKHKALWVAKSADLHRKLHLSWQDNHLLAYIIFLSAFSVVPPFSYLKYLGKKALTSLKNSCRDLVPI